ncbi:MAG TPA: Lrp/AsnC family transcriptional regulator, partial [archaeon]|nr:Lrp/AsnC family transcriptional regulator [archaeon]
RIKKLEKSGILQFQPGINFKVVDLFLALVELKTKNPEKIIEQAKYCPFVLNCFRMSGDHNILVMLSSSKLKKLDNIVNYHYRNNPDVQNISMELVVDIAKDFILPIDFDSEHHNPTAEEGCGEKCKVKIAREKGLIQ